VNAGQPERSVGNPEKRQRRDAGQRSQYLAAIGIDVWVPRRGVPAPALEVAKAAEQGPAEAPTPAVARAVAPPAVPLTADAEAQWEILRSEIMTCTRCPLHSTRTQGVVGVGYRQADWLVIGEAPGAEEDRRGEPFVGRAGQLLDAMLRAIGLSRNTNVYIANVLKSRPPGNRDPKPEEVAACLP